MNARNQVENVRYNLDGADKARAKSKEYATFADVLRPTDERVEATISGRSIRAIARWFMSNESRVATIKLSEEQMNLLHTYFAESAEAELRRAQGYEQQAIRAAGGTPEPIEPWLAKDRINPNRITVSVSDFIEDPLETIARENA